MKQLGPRLRCADWNLGVVPQTSLPSVKPPASIGGGPDLNLFLGDNFLKIPLFWHGWFFVT